MDLSTILYFALALVVLLTITNVIPVKIWVTARFTGTDLPFRELLFMKFRGLNPDKIGMAMITASKGELTLTHFDLQAYELAGGDSQSVVRALLIAKRDKVPFSLKEAYDALENKIDVIQLVNEAAKQKNKSV